MKKVLVIAYNFPPGGGSGMQRTTKFCKYLRDYGWQPTVITTNEFGHSSIDYSLLEELADDIDIIRVPFCSIDRLRMREKNKLYAIYNKIVTLLNLLLSIPDYQIIWNRKVKKQLKKLSLQTTFDIVYISCAPFSTSLLCKTVKKYLKVPVVVDFRDSWSRAEWIKFLPGYRKLNRAIEKLAFTRMDGFLTVSEPILNDFIKDNHFEGECKVITNGYDREDFGDKKEPNQNSSKLVFTYSGSFSGNRNPVKFLQAIDELIDEGELTENEIEVKLIGYHDKYLNFRPYIKTIGFVNHSHIFSQYQDSDVLLLIIPSEGWKAYTGKIFEYLIAGKIIFGIIPEGVAEKLIKSSNTGITCNVDDLCDIKNKLCNVMSSWRKGELTYSPDYTVIKQYDRKHLTSELTVFFDRVIGASNK